MKLRKRDLFLLVATPALMLGAIGTAGTVSNNKASEVVAAGEKYTFNKVTSTSDITDGIYLIYCPSANAIFDGSLTKLDVASNTKAVTITNNSLAEASANQWSKYAFTISTSAGTLKSASGYYIGQTSYGNGLTSHQTTTYTNTFAINNDGEAVITVSTSGGDVTLRYNDASNQNRFRYYKSGQKAIELYKGTVQTDAPAESITISADKTTIVVGRNTATVTLTPTNCDPDSVTWSSEDTNVATVTGDASSATVTPIATGDTVIKATYDNGGDAVVSNEIAIHVSSYGEVTVSNSLSLTSTNLGIVTTSYNANNGVKVVDGVSYSLNNVQKSTGDKGSGIQLKVEDSLFCNLNAFSKNIYRIKIKLAYGTTLPNVYACDGLRQLDHQIEVSNNEARRTGTGYYEYDMSAEATKYFAITSNGSNAPYMAEIIIAFAPDTYLADFNLEGGSMDAEEIVELSESENTITLPTPVRANYEFAGWSDGENIYEGGEQVTLYKDTSFTAQWDNTTILQPLVNGVESQMALAYHYTSATLVTSNDQLVAGAKYLIGYKDSSIENGKVAGTKYSSWLTSVDAAITNEKVLAVPEDAAIITLEEGANGGWHLSTNDEYIDGGNSSLSFNNEASTSWTIEISNDTKHTASIKVGSALLQYNSANPRFRTYTSTQKAINLYRVFEEPTAPQFRLKVGLDASIVDLSANEAIDECGIAVTAGGTTQRFAYGDLHTDDTGIRYVTIDLGDVINNYSRATTAFMVRAYAKSGDDYIYTTDAEKYKNRSVRDMVNVYHGKNEYRDVVDGLWSFFNAVSAY